MMARENWDEFFDRQDVMQNQSETLDLHDIVRDAINDSKATVNHPKHYTEHPSGIECIQITEHMNFCMGNAMKYIWRAGLKGDSIEDLEKAIWYLNREIQRREIQD